MRSLEATTAALHAPSELSGEAEDDAAPVGQLNSKRNQYEETKKKLREEGYQKLKKAIRFSEREKIADSSNSSDSNYSASVSSRGSSRASNRKNYYQTTKKTTTQNTLRS